MNKNLFSAAGLVAVSIFLLLSVAIISALPSIRIDLTQDKLFTLSDGTKNIVSDLDKPIEMIFFYSDAATADVPQLRAYGTRVQELIREMVIASSGNLTFRVVDPEPFSEEEDLATGYGIQAVPLSAGGQEVYFGLVVVDAEEVDAETALPGSANHETLGLIRPDQEEFLEYEFVKLISRVANPKLPVVGIMSSLDIDGGYNPSIGQATPPWVIADSIRQLYEVRRLDPAAESIEEDIDILFIVHPQDSSEQTLYAIDQHILGGGKAMIFVDPNADTAVSQDQFGGGEGSSVQSSDLGPLLASWGVAYDKSMFLTDAEFALRVVVGPTRQPVAHLGMLGVQRKGLNTGDIVTSQLENLNLSSAGSISPIEGASTLFEPLISSSESSMLMDASFIPALSDPSILVDEFVASGQVQIIAARITGPVVSAFPNGRPVVNEPIVAEPVVAEPVVEEANVEEVEDSVVEESEPSSADLGSNPENVELAADADSEVEASAPHIADSVQDINVIIIADTDILSDRLWVQVGNFMGQRVSQPFANNGDMVVNSLDNLLGSADLVSIRSRGRYSRPFTKVLELQRLADERLRTEETELLRSLEETGEALAALNQTPEGQPILELSPEQEAEIEKFNELQLETRKSLRSVRFELNRDIELLGARLKFINTALVPIILTLLMLFFGVSKSRKRRVRI